MSILHFVVMKCYTSFGNEKIFRSISWMFCTGKHISEGYTICCSLSITTFTVILWKPSIKSLWKLLIKTFCNNITINQIFEGYEKNQKGIFQPQWTQKHESLSLLTCMDVVLPFLSRFYTSECFHILLICLVHDWARTRLHHRKEK